jgi:hypothetical protein
MTGKLLLCYYQGKNKEQLFLASLCFYAYKNLVARPKTNPDKHRQNVAITLDPALLSQARKLAASDGKSLSQVIESQLRSWILMEAIKQSSPSMKPEHLKIITDTGYGLEVRSMSSDGSAELGNVTTDEDPFVAQARKAAENTKNRDEVRKSKTLSEKSGSVAAPPPRKRRRMIDMEPETSFVPPSTKPKRKRIIG